MSLRAEHPGDAQITQLDNALSSEKNVGTLRSCTCPSQRLRSRPRRRLLPYLDVAVEDTARVHVLEPQTNLQKDAPNIILCECGSISGLEQPLQVAHLAVLHDDAEVWPVDKGVKVPHDVRVIQGRHDLRLPCCSRLLLGAHRGNVNLLHYVELPVFVAPDLPRAVAGRVRWHTDTQRAEAPLPQQRTLYTAPKLP